MTEKTILRRDLGPEAKGKKFIVMNSEDDDFPKGEVVTCVDEFGEHFFSEDYDSLFMYPDVLLKPIDSTLTFAELATLLPALEVGTEFRTDYSSVLYVGHQDQGESGNKFLYWKSNDKPVSVTEVTVGATYTELQKEPAKPEFTKIDWKEALQIVADGGTVYADDEKIEVSKYTDIETELYCEDLLELTTWFKKTE